MSRTIAMCLVLASALVACAGETGEAGEKGDNGADGAAGVPGADGADGTGSPGADGADGADGDDGAPGLDGDDGVISTDYFACDLEGVQILEGAGTSCSLDITAAGAGQVAIVNADTFVRGQAPSPSYIALGFATFADDGTNVEISNSTIDEITVDDQAFVNLSSHSTFALADGVQTSVGAELAALVGDVNIQGGHIQITITIVQE